jgi:hypothetical protein
MMSAFETGTPSTGLEFSTALGALLASGTACLARFPDSIFFAPQGAAWSPSDHIRHLTKAAVPLALALRMPRWMIGLRFGRGSSRSRSFTEMRDIYLATLARGAQAGRFSPEPEPAPAAPQQRRQEIMNAWAGATVDLQGIIATWPEEALDRHRLPHPLLGRLTVREMLAFTVYHTAHHLRRIAERAGD